MAERRMFARSIINSARFLRMPPTSRLLYYDLGMAADDDGVVEAFTVLRTTGAAEDDLRVLVSKNFVRVLNEDLVSFIVDWKSNNLIKSDRYHPSQYKALLVAISDGGELEPVWNPYGSDMEPEVRLGEDSSGEVRSGDARRSRFFPPTLEQVTSYCEERQNKVDPQRWFDYYVSNGWRVGKNPMRDWKAAVRSWERNSIGAKSRGPNGIELAANDDHTLDGIL